MRAAARYLLGGALVVGPALAVNRLETNELERFLGQSLNPHIRPYAYPLASVIWASRTINVCWDNPEDATDQRREVVRRAVVDTWDRESALEIVGWSRCHGSPSGIRIRIADSDSQTLGLGNDLDGVEGGMTLNLIMVQVKPDCTKSPDECLHNIAVHEFGHALGFSHEQNRPDAGDCYKKRQGPNGNVTNLTPYDPKSVMNYCDDTRSGQLSSLDISAVRALYGSPVDRAPALGG